MTWLLRALFAKLLFFRYRHIPYSSSTTSSVTVQNEENENYYTGEIDLNNLQIPIVGYEVMEERARFTVSLA